MAGLYYATLQYNANGGSGAPNSETIQSAIPNNPYTFTISKTKPTRSNYTFKGWAESSSASTAQYSNPATSYTQSTIVVNTGYGPVPEHTTTLYAVWQSNSNQYSAVLKYNANGGSGAPNSQTKTSSSPSASVTFTVRSTESNPPTRSGYTFRGWAKSSSATVPKYLNPTDPNISGTSTTYTTTTGTSSNPTNTDTLYAVWKASKYYIRYHPGSNGTGSDVTDNKEHGTPITLRGAIYTRSGYTQTGWSKTDGGSKDYSLKATYSTNKSIDLYPYWSRTDYTVTYLPNGGSGSSYSQSVSSGQTWVTYSGSGFTKSGHKLIGWSTSSDGPVEFYLGQPQPVWNRTSNLELYAIWEALHSIVHVMTSNGLKNARVYVKTSSGMKIGYVFVKGSDGKMHQNS